MRKQLRKPQSHKGHQQALTQSVHQAAHGSLESAKYFFKLGMAAIAGGDADAALQAFRRTLEVQPDLVPALLNLGTLAAKGGQFADAANWYRRAVMVAPDFLPAQLGFVNALLCAGRHQEAAQAARQAVAAGHRASAELLSLIVMACAGHDDLHGARAAYLLLPGMAARMDTGCDLAYARTLIKHGHPAEATALLESAAATWPDKPEILRVLGDASVAAGRMDGARNAYNRVLELYPNEAAAHHKLGLVHMASANPAMAVAHLECACRHDPSNAHANSNLAIAYLRSGRLEEGIDQFRHAIALQPTLFNARLHLAIALLQSGREGEAEQELRASLDLCPPVTQSASELLFALCHFPGIGPAELYRHHAEFGRQHSARVTPNSQVDPVPSSRSVPRVGFVSGDLRSHPVAQLLAPIWPHLVAASEIETYVYSTSPIVDDTTGQFHIPGVKWRSLVGLNDRQAASMIRQDQIDILIDLSGHTENNRLDVFALKAAPLQMSWLGYPYTTGLETVDYYIGDRAWIPIECAQQNFVEKLIWLPVAALFAAPTEYPPVNVPPSISKGYITFGAFIRPLKLNERTIQLWSKVLGEVNDSKIIVGGLSGSQQFGYIKDKFAQHNIHGERLILRPRLPASEFAKLLQEVDILLDGIPYGAGTTALHAAWMGIPTVTIAGALPQSRQTAAINHHLRMSEYVAKDESEYVSLACAGARDRSGLSITRMALRDRLANSIICQPERLAGALVFALRQAWQRSLSGASPESFEVCVKEVA